MRCYLRVTDADAGPVRKKRSRSEIYKFMHAPKPSADKPASESDHLVLDGASRVAFALIACADGYGGSMTKAVFTASEHSDYQDLRERWYHFPNRYLGQVKETVGDFVVFYEPRRNNGPSSSNGSQSYIAMARVVGIRPDTRSAGHYFADLAEYIRFDLDVPFRIGNRYFESALRKQDGTSNRGAFGWSVRALPEVEFEAIFRTGFSRTLSRHQSLRQDDVRASELNNSEIIERETIRVELSRKVRDAAFRERVRDAYDNTCAVTGFSLTDPSGLAEVQAAHIRPVASNGPDTIGNGIALTGTAHWLFDKGIISVSDDFQILISRYATTLAKSQAIKIGERLRMPSNAAHAPNTVYLNWHRNEIFIE